LLQPLQESGDAGLPNRIVCGGVHEHANATHALGLLRSRHHLPHRRTAKQPRRTRAAFIPRIDIKAPENGTAHHNTRIAV
jgi:hypothetical protein